MKADGLTGLASGPGEALRTGAQVAVTSVDARPAVVARTEGKQLTGFPRCRMEHQEIG